MKGIPAAIAAAALAAVLAAPAHAVIVTNGSFENTESTFSGNAQDYMLLSPASTTIPGWTVIDNPLAWIGPTNPFGLSASNGSFFLDLTADSANGPYGGVSQTISTVAGGLYQVSFDLGGSTTYGVPDSLKACAGITCLAASITATGTNDWDHETFDFTAGAGTTTVLTLVGTSGVNYIGLDNVAVNVVPLPNSLVLLGTGLLAAVAVFFRRRKRTFPRALVA